MDPDERTGSDAAEAAEADEIARFEEIGRQAGASLRRAPDANELAVVTKRGGQRRTRVVASAVTAAGVLIAAGVFLASRRDDEVMVTDTSVAATSTVPPTTVTNATTSTNSISTTSVVPTTTSVAETTTIAALVDGVPTLSADSSFTLPLSNPNGTDFSFTSDGQRVIARDGTTDWAMVDLASGEVVRRLTADYTAEGGPDFKLTVSPDGSRATDGRRLWNMETGALIKEISAYGPRRFAFFSPDSSKLAVNTWQDAERVTVFDARQGNALFDLPHAVYLPAFSPDSSALLTFSAGGTLDDSTLEVLDSASGRLQRTIRTSGGGIVFLAGGTRLLIAGPPVPHIYDYATGDEVGTIPVDFTEPTRFSPDGALLVGYAPGEYSVKRVWDTTTGARITDMDAHFTRVYGPGSALEFSPDGSLILAGVDQLPATPASNGVPGLPVQLGLGVFDAKTGQLVATLAPYIQPSGAVNASNPGSAHFSPDGSKIVVRHVDGSFSVWPMPEA